MMSPVMHAETSGVPPRPITPKPPDTDTAAAWMLLLGMAQGTLQASQPEASPATSSEAPPPPMEKVSSQHAHSLHEAPSAHLSTPSTRTSQDSTPETHPVHEKTTRLATKEAIPTGTEIPEDVLQALVEEYPGDGETTFPKALLAHLEKQAVTVHTTPLPPQGTPQAQLSVDNDSGVPEPREQTETQTPDNAGTNQEHDTQQDHAFERPQTYWPEPVQISVDASPQEEFSLPPLPSIEATVQAGKAAATTLLQQPQLFAAWLERLLQPSAGNVQHLPDGWKSIQFQLGEETSLLTLKARKHENGILIAASTNDPKLHAQMVRDAHRLESILQERYDTPVSFSMDNDGQRHSRENTADQRASRMSTEHLPSTSEEEATPIASPRLYGQTHEWIG